MATTNRTAQLRPGTRVRLPDGTLATVSSSVGIGRPWDGTYTTRQPSTFGTRVDEGWRREQLEVVS